MDFFIVDVFAEQAYCGNQLAVVILSQDIAEQQKCAIASEFNFSETTFVHAYEKGDAAVRVDIFTPQRQVPFAGHPVLGTAFVLHHFLHIAAHQKLKLTVGEVPVHVDTQSGQVWMQQPQPQFFQQYKALQIAPLLGLDPSEIDPQFPIQCVSTGLPMMLIPLVDLQAVQRARYNAEKYQALFSTGSQMPLYVFSKQTYTEAADINCRMFAEAFGITEDPATGSACGCLGAYAVKYGYLQSKNQVSCTVEQGFEINRKSILRVTCQNGDTETDIRVGGGVVAVAKGTLL